RRCAGFSWSGPKRRPMITSLTRWIVALAFAVAPPSAFAQSAAAATSSSEIPRADIDKAIARALSELKPGVSISDHLVGLADIGKYNVAVAVVARPAGIFQSSLSHDKITEVYYILKGSATQVTGTMVNGTRQARVSTTIGPSMTSDAPLQDAR